MIVHCRTSLAPMLFNNNTFFFGISFVFQLSLSTSCCGCIILLYLVVVFCTSCFILKAPFLMFLPCLYTPRPLQDPMRMMYCTCSSSTCCHSSVHVSVFALPVGFFSTCEWCYVFFLPSFLLFCWFAPFQPSVRAEALIILFLCVCGKTYESPGIAVLGLGKKNQ